MMRVKRRLAAALLGSLAIGVALPGTGMAAPYPSAQVRVCNYYTDSDGIAFSVTGANQYNVQVTTPIIFLDRDRCALVKDSRPSTNYTDYWWRTGTVIKVWNNRVIRTSGSSGYTDPKTTKFFIPSNAPDGSLQLAKLPV